ncbi:uncharacterized protein NFIA_003410 [Aspergillus fischeri NRRL 181]|uniref:Glycosyl hydrolase family 92 N-terminal domain-containing protein n=1 Tax=Neosartorya fischeri (strain ATCC 1020 / DSM 3700 / CBS 544.65 / FGSC A1164 / JCM 1740 / NRRL 181 / WB 181) TaxID=331117 RepID=A1DJU7_NEOFI|nr:uncharacterized protein NFIA_003410 [Aspergillus fischeri NRRL 181]EAW16986.1 hypothetical protein NFIA_003410 [Aspergillus fischeri NRRL 181]
MEKSAFPSNSMQAASPNSQITNAFSGHSFAGATWPFGMAKAVADTLREKQAGFAYDTKYVPGFSHMHDSGTGGVH